MSGDLPYRVSTCPQEEVDTSNGGRKVKALFRFINCAPNSDGRLRYYSGALEATKPGTILNPPYAERLVFVRDLRNEYTSLRFAAHGIEFIQYDYPMNLKPENLDAVMQYLGDVVRIVKSHFSAEVVVCYDYKVCCSGSEGFYLTNLVSSK
jgi:hypothetical protein